jgi:Zn-dependent protease
MLTGIEVWSPAMARGEAMSGKTEQLPARGSGTRSPRNGLRLSKQQRAGVGRWAVGIVAGGSFGAVSMFPAVVVSDGHPAAPLLAGLIALAFIAVSVLVHEIGHAVAAWAVGWRVHLIVVGPFAFAPRQRKFIPLGNRRQRPDFLGWVHVTPPPDSGWIKGAIPIKLGGAMGNLALGAVSALSALAIYDTAANPYFAVLAALAVASVIFAAANLVPFSRPGAWKSDGASAIAVLKGEEPTLREQMASRLSGMVFDGVPAEDWDVSALNELAGAPPGERWKSDPLLISYAFGMADLAAAKLLLQRHLEAKPHSPLEYRCMYAFAIAMIDRDGPGAAVILEDLPRKAAEKSFSYWRARAVTSHLLGNRDEALAALRNARHAAGKIGAAPDEDDELIFHAIAQDADLPRLEPRGRLSITEDSAPEPGASEDSGQSDIR